MLRRYFPLAALALGMFLQVSPATLHALTLGPAGLATVSLPSVSIPLQESTRADFDRDGQAESLVLASGRLTIFSSGGPAWQSPASWDVIQAAVTDLNHDGLPEATMLVWRPFRPWPVDQWLPYGGRITPFQDASGQSCHIILVGWRDGQFREVWAGSALAEPVRAFAAADLKGTGNQYLVTLEGSYTESRLAPGKALKVWEWNGFGFSVVSSMVGSFEPFALVQANPGRILILVP